MRRNKSGYSLKIQNTISNLTNYKTQKEWASEWKTRLDALIELQEYFQDDDFYEFDGFSEAIDSLVDPLNTQLTDLRSIIIKESCNLLNLMVQELGDSFDPVAAQVMSNLIKLTFVTIKVISQSASKCVKTIINNCKINKAFGAIIRQARSKHKILKTRCYEFFLQVLMEQPEVVENSDKYVNSMKKLIEIGINDGVGEVRAYSRKCFWYFKQVCPTDANDVYVSLDGTSQKNLKKEQAKLGLSKEKGKKEKPKKKKGKKKSPRKKKSSPKNKTKKVQNVAVELGNVGVEPEPVKENLLLKTTSIKKKPKKGGKSKGGRKTSKKIGSRKIKKGKVDEPGELSYETMVKKSESNDWEVRRRFFIELQKYLSTTFDVNESSVLFSRIVYLCLGKTDDNHFKVVLEVLKSLKSLMSLFPEEFESFLEKTLKKMFLKLSDSKPMVRKEAQSLVIEVSKQYDVGICLNVGMKSCMDSNTKVQMTALEYIFHHLGCEDAKKWTSVTKNLKKLLTKMCKISLSKAFQKVDIQKVVWGILRSLNEKEPKRFLQQVNLLPSDFRFFLSEFYQFLEDEELGNGEESEEEEGEEYGKTTKKRIRENQFREEFVEDEELELKREIKRNTNFQIIGGDVSKRDTVEFF